jgi:acid stress-induced BolA-like protein IbaG/YrbA
MSDHPTDFKGSVSEAVSKAIGDAIAGAKVDVSGGGGHYSIVVTSSAFEGKSTLESQRMVYSAIGHLMKGDMAPIHAVDSLKTKAV